MAKDALSEGKHRKEVRESEKESKRWKICETLGYVYVLGEIEKFCHTYAENSDRKWWIGNLFFFVTTVIMTFTHDDGWRYLPQCSHGLKARGVQKRILIIGSADLLALSTKEIQAAQRRKAEGPSVSRCSELSGKEWGKRWRARETEQSLIWMHRPSPVSAHSNVCPARLTRPGLAPITHSPALPTGLSQAQIWRLHWANPCRRTH